MVSCVIAQTFEKHTLISNLESRQWCNEYGEIKGTELTGDGIHFTDLTDEASSPGAESLCSASSDSEGECCSDISDELVENDSLRGNSDFKEKFESEDLSQFYFSDEDEDSSDEMYTEFDAMEYDTEAVLQKRLSDEGDDVDERELVLRMLHKRESDIAKARKQHHSHHRGLVDIQSIKATWLLNVDTTASLPGFTMVLTCEQDPFSIRCLCRA